MDEKKKREFAELLNGLTDEQKEKAKACRDGKELIALLDEMGVALPEEALDAVAGGTEQIWMFFPEAKKSGGIGSDKQEPQPVTNFL